MPKRCIEPVVNNKEKQETYTFQLGQYRKAMDEDFFLEAMMIVYSMMEDRLKSLLYYCGVFDSRDTLKISKVVAEDIRTAIGEEKYKLSNITGKVAMCADIVNWHKLSNSFEHEYSPYLMCLKDAIDGLDTDEVTEVFAGLRKWLDYRNEVMHAAMNKNIYSLYDGLREKVEEGMEYARALDSYVRILKKDNSVRKQLKMG